MNNETMVAPATHAMDGLTQIHNQLREQYSETTNGITEPDTQSLMAYNGYYSLTGEGTPAGAFFTVDTNMVITNGGAPVYHISLIISLNGTQSNIFSFTRSSATFVKATATLTWPQSPSSEIFAPDINITFTRENNGSGVTATFTGSISLFGNPKFTGTGKTYNNIIPVTMYEGKYHEGTEKGSPLTMEIKEGYGLTYRDLFSTKEPTAVDSYIYNMNMYFFSFQRNKYMVKLIMGTSAAAGLVCNDLTAYNEHGAIPIPRSLQTILSTKNVEPNLNDKSEELMQYAGFYRISSTTPSAFAIHAFISIEGIYTVKSSGTEYKVEVGVSTDGKTSKVFTIDSTMTFDGSTLTIPAFNFNTEDLSITFDRTYVADGNHGSLVTISGNIGSTPFTGSTPLNPVPLSAFGGAEMKSMEGTETLSINNYKELTYQGVAITKLLYVPVMYIVAFDAEAADNIVMLSLGTDGGKGNTCIVTDKEATKQMNVVYAIPDGDSGQATPPQN